MNTTMQCSSIQSSVDKWTGFNKNLQSQTKGKLPPPFDPVEVLVKKYLKKPKSLLKKSSSLYP